MAASLQNSHFIFHKSDILNINITTFYCNVIAQVTWWEATSSGYGTSKLNENITTGGKDKNGNAS